MNPILVRLSIEPLVKMYGTVCGLGRALGVHSTQVNRWRRTGLTIATADRLAIAVGLHPVDLWPEWYDLPVIVAEAA
jgi:plasmid maintenance system antidote protein VapI